MSICHDFAMYICPTSFTKPAAIPTEANMRVRASQVFLLIRLKPSLAKRQKNLPKWLRGATLPEETRRFTGCVQKTAILTGEKEGVNQTPQHRAGPYTATKLNYWHSRKCKGHCWQLQLKPEAQEKNPKHL